jgi:hypothetical protein
MLKIITLLMLANLICFYSIAQTDSIPNQSIKLIQTTITADSVSQNSNKIQRKFGFITNVPDDLLQIAKSPFEKKNFKGLALATGTMALFIWQDQNMLNGVQQFGKHVNLKPATSFSVPLSIGGSRIIKIPNNLNTALYQLGEGGTSMYIAGGLFIYSKINHDARSLQTASDLTESFFSMGITTQIIKRISGRQTPSSATQNGGEWSPFPSFSNYKDNIANYDSFPSGHLATMMATVTVLTENYPEKKWIKPIGYSLIGLTGFAMMNNGVHWIGDYPLALALGYISGKITVNRQNNKYNHHQIH